MVGTGRWPDATVHRCQSAHKNVIQRKRHRAFGVSGDWLTCIRLICHVESTGIKSVLNKIQIVVALRAAQIIVRVKRALQRG